MQTEQEWRESLKECDRVVVKEDEGDKTYYWMGCVLKKDADHLLIRRDGFSYEDKVVISSGHFVGVEACSIVPPADEGAQRYFLSEQIKAAIGQGVLNLLPIEVLEDLAGILG